MRVAILGNSGSGKSTLASQLAAGRAVDILDLDTIFWEPDQIAVPRDIAIALADLNSFCRSHDQWIVEGCYGNLIEAALIYEPELVFLDPGLERCLSNCRGRTWEAHKYSSREEQDSKLEYLLQWVTDYYERDGDMSLAGHEEIYASYDGPKRRVSDVHIGETRNGV